jgi:hypothetical protein
MLKDKLKKLTMPQYIVVAYIITGSVLSIGMAFTKTKV